MIILYGLNVIRYLWIVVLVNEVSEAFWFASQIKNVVHTVCIDGNK